MKNDVFNKALELQKEILYLTEKIVSCDDAIVSQTTKTSYKDDELFVSIGNGHGNNSVVYINRRLIIELLAKARAEYKRKKDEASALFDEL